MRRAPPPKKVYIVPMGLGALCGLFAGYFGLAAINHSFCDYHGGQWNDAQKSCDMTKAPPDWKEQVDDRVQDLQAAKPIEMDALEQQMGVDLTPPELLTPDR